MGAPDTKAPGGTPVGQSRRSARSDDQRGAVALFMVAVLAIMMLSSAFVVDLGLQRVARSDMQAMADLAALDLARHLDGREVGALTPVLDDALADTVARNTDAVGVDADLTFQMGRMTDGGFETLASGVPSAVRVVARTDVDFAFSAVTGSDSGAASRSAAAESSTTACFRLGSFVAAVRSGDSGVVAPLNHLLGVRLDMVGYREIADAGVTLGQLAATSVFGSPERLLSSATTYRDLIAASIEALSKESGGNNAMAIRGLNRILSSNATAAVGRISLAEVLHVAPTDKAAMAVELDVLDIVGSARLANGKHFIEVPNIQAQVPGIGNQFSGGIQLVSAAELACGAPNSPEAKADTAQLSGTLAVDFINMPSVRVPGLGTLQTPKGTGSLEVSTGIGSGQLVAPPVPRCGDGTASDPATFSVDVSTGLASYQLTAKMSVAGDVKTDDLVDLGLDPVLTRLLGDYRRHGAKLHLEAEIELRVGAGSRSGGGRANLSIPPNDETPVRTGSSMSLDMASLVPTVTSVKLHQTSAQLSTVTEITRPLIDAFVNTQKGFVDKTLTPFVANINSRLIGPVARMVGLQFAGADVYAVGVTCAHPRLVG